MPQCIDAPLYRCSSLMRCRVLRLVTDCSRIQSSIRATRRRILINHLIDTRLEVRNILATQVMGYFRAECEAISMPCLGNKFSVGEQSHRRPRLIQTVDRGSWPSHSWCYSPNNSPAQDFDMFTLTLRFLQARQAVSTVFLWGGKCV